MRTRILFFEYLVASFFALQVLLPEVFTWQASLFIFLFIVVLKYNYEGLRITFLVYILVQIGLIVFSHPILNMMLALITYVILTYFPVYHFPETKGPFLVGYRDLTLQKNVKVSVFYPTLQQTQKVLYKTSEDGWVRIYDIMRSYPGHFIPKFIYKMMFGFLDYLDIGVNLNARIISPQFLSHHDKFPAIVFSHGLSANRNLYTGFARQWASYGYIVCCIDHEETIYVEFKDWENFRQQRVIHLKDRCAVISQVIDFLYDSKKVAKFFQTSTVQIDYERLCLAGHSFGSAAVTEVATNEQRITGALVLLDPWLYPASDKALETPAKRPVLVLRSESFENVFEEFKVKQRIQRYVVANKDHHDETLSCYLKKSTHNSFCDLIIHMPREMKLFGVIEDTKDIEEVYNSQTMLSQIFLDLMLYSPIIPEFDSKKSLVIKAFESFLLKNGSSSKLEIDSF